MTPTIRQNGHDCPGCDEPGVPFRMLACRRCWARLPGDLQTAVYRGLRRGWHSDAHLAALADAAAWYRANPLSVPRVWTELFEGGR